MQTVGNRHRTVAIKIATFRDWNGCDGCWPGVCGHRNDSGNELTSDEFTFTLERGRTIGGAVRDERKKGLPVALFGMLL